MTVLSVNLNKIALLRNSRGRDFPNVIDFTKRFINLGVKGITIHPRPDERHITRRDAYQLADLLADHSDVEFNIEGYPSADFFRIIADTRPTQCTLVPDADEQLTSDHGWDLQGNKQTLTEAVKRINDLGVRSAVFLDPDCEQVARVPDTGANRIELYTEDYANAFADGNYHNALEQYRQANNLAQRLQIGVNAGHDLDMKNLSAFLAIGGILEVSIGHALTVECIELGMQTVVKRYLDICGANSGSRGVVLKP